MELGFWQWVGILVAAVFQTAVTVAGVVWFMSKELAKRDKAASDLHTRLRIVEDRQETDRKSFAELLGFVRKVDGLVDGMRTQIAVLNARGHQERES